MYIADPFISSLNTFVGSAMQQATSVVTRTDQNCYEGSTGCFSVYGFEYKPGFDNAVCPHRIKENSCGFSFAFQYISWVSDSKLAWTILSTGMGPDPLVEISARPVSQEPMVCSIRATRSGLSAKHNFSILSLTWEYLKVLASLTWTTCLCLYISGSTTYACINPGGKRTSVASNRTSLPNPTLINISKHIPTPTSPLGWTTTTKRCRGKSFVIFLVIGFLRK